MRACRDRNEAKTRLRTMMGGRMLLAIVAPGLLAGCMLGPTAIGRWFRLRAHFAICNRILSSRLRSLLMLTFRGGRFSRIPSCRT